MARLGNGFGMQRKMRSRLLGNVKAFPGGSLASYSYHISAVSRGGCTQLTLC